MEIIFIEVWKMMICLCFLLYAFFHANALKIGTADRQECNITFQRNTETRENLDIPAKLLCIKLEFRNTTTISPSVGRHGNLYQPLQWVKTSGAYGSGLLQLRPTYEILSLTSLSIQTERTRIQVEDSPAGCLEFMNASDYELAIRRFLFHHSNTEEDDEETDENDYQICNARIENDDGYAEFYYECCYVDGDENMVCYRVEQNVWMKMIDICQYIVVVFAVLYCPWLIPSSLYRKKYIPTTFVHHLQEPIKLKVKKTHNPMHWWRNIARTSDEMKLIQKITSLSKFGRMKQFRQIIDKMRSETVYEFPITKIHLKVRHDEIISENNVPTGLLKTFYDAFVNCGIRDKHDRKDCCNANIFGCLAPCGKEYPWFKCLRLLMHILLSIMVCSPWIFRLCVFYFYEKEIKDSREEAADDRNLDTSFRTNLIYSLTPIHVLFIICYAVVGLESLILGSVSKRFLVLIQTMMQGCLQDMHDSSSSRTTVLKWAFRILTTPLRKFGIFGLIIGVLYWIFILPIVLITLLFHWFPTINLTLSLLGRFFSIMTPKCCKYCFTKFSFLVRLVNFLCDTNDDTEGESQEDEHEDEIRDAGKVTKSIGKSLSLRLIIIIMATISFCSFVVLTVECIIFLTQVAVYTTIGLILNSSHAMQYISAISIGWLYFHNCFGGIDKLYLRYNRAIHNLIREENKSLIEEVAAQSCDVQENTAFKVHGTDPSNAVLEMNYGTPKWSTHGVFLLMDKYDKTYLTKQFFFDSCKIDHPHCPQELSGHVLQATRRFLTIVLFLMFVTLVVLAFGDAYSVSISNQLLATVAGGFVPWLLMKSDLLFPKAELPDLDKLKESMNFTNSLRDLKSSDEEYWNIDDIEISGKLDDTLIQNCGHAINSVSQGLSKHLLSSIISNGTQNNNENPETDAEDILLTQKPEVETVDLLIEDTDAIDFYHNLYDV